MLFLLRGTVRVTATGAQGEIVALPEIEGGDYLGQSTLTREPADTDARALSEVTVFEVPQAAVDAITARDPGLRNELGRAIEGRREMVIRAVEGVARRRQHDAAPAER
jgi:CRP-like cAMP-binding protein